MALQKVSNIVLPFQIIEQIDEPRTENLEFDQLILEFYQQGKPSSGWVHCSYKTDGNNRGKIMTALRVNGKTEYKEGLIQ